ncbi:tripartite tricarboxylate transporter substrate binding protein [Bradyrhizobium manausense]|uniref:tripartite tricarboxylate transporter substrate binding protein n=1 Tax=Bradyrhizobium TaxID=374 RepID=UPI001BA50420|nr:MULTISPECIES: tripartite tricarboxylate transporter substrate binding protein [Bradyrhizobium]MBR0825127.1 tripartite tricarboxylate transporter substrate binding protein [Bradyrhizobium manausense]UVO32430.1 tripartite tricarboxylate transporter substrate binding protein [Bradyrhizobium arachidis]
MTRISRRQMTALMAGAVVAPFAAPAIVSARSSQTVFIIVPYASGGSIDSLMRSIAKGMSEVLDQPVLVDNKPGANGIVGSQYVARATKDGSVLLAGGTGPISLNVLLRKNLPYKLTDFASVAMLCNGPLSLTVNAKMPAADMKSFVAYAKGRDKPLFYATLGPGSVTHLFGIMMGKSMGFAVTDVAYRNNPASIMELLSGECDLNFATPAAVVEHVKAGQLRLLAVSSDKRLPNLPDVPTLAESGYPELSASFWTALHAPAGTPREVIDRLNAAANAAMKKPEIAKQLEIDCLQADLGPPQLLDSQLSKDAALWGPVITAQNIALD